MKHNPNTSLRIEKSVNSSGKIRKAGRIPYLKDRNYYTLDFDLDGDAPKEFIKAYFYEHEGGIRKSKPKTWRAYIAKTAEKWYPNESVIEFLVNRIGQELGLKMNQVKLVYANGQIRFLSQYFLEEGDTMLHGAEICGEYLEDEEFAKQIANDKKSARELFSFEFIYEAMRSVFPADHLILMNELVKLIVFDAIVGNNDRHFYNWAVIRSVNKDRATPCFSPIYDSARGLMWNWSDKDLIRHYQHHLKAGKKVGRYIDSACPRISVEGNAHINHFDLVAYLWNAYPGYRGTIRSLISLEKGERVLTMYRREFSMFFGKERNYLVNYILKTRFKNLRKVTDHD